MDGETRAKGETMSNYPDDWGAYRSRCCLCGAWEHASGAEPCNCEPCDTCGQKVPPELTAELATGDDAILCEDCWSDKCCEYCGGYHPIGLVKIRDWSYCPECYSKEIKGELE